MCAYVTVNMIVPKLFDDLRNVYMSSIEIFRFLVGRILKNYISCLYLDYKRDVNC